MPRGRSRSASPPRHRHRRRSRSPAHSRSPRRSETQNAHRNRRKSRSRRRRSDAMPRIPDNWVDVAKMGALVGSSRFLPLRVPLDATHLPSFKNKKDQIWTPKDFLEAQQEQELNVKMIIDLTNTFKYYNGEEEFKDSGVQYVKLKIEGFNGPPAARDVARFMEIVDEFMERELEGTVAVHCTHGLNRTGYLIVNYMVERLSYTVTEALEAFKVARPPGLIKHMYVEELYKRLGQEGEQVQLPEMPAWASAKYSKKERKPRGHYGKHSRHVKRDKEDKGEKQGQHLRFDS